MKDIKEIMLDILKRDKLITNEEYEKALKELKKTLKPVKKLV